MMEMDGQNQSFEVRALELHSQYAWDYNWIINTMDFMKDLDFNTLVLHRNDFIDLIIYPGKYFGYEEKAGDTIFETYSHIFRKLYQYTPTRRSGPYQRRAFLKRVLEQAKRRGIDVYIENKELYFPDILLEFYPNLVHDGHICATDPFWLEFLQVKYRDFFREFPEVAGIITAPATGESRVSIKSNRCQCERCRCTRKEDWFDNVLRAMYAPIHEAGKTLVVRDFVFDPQAHGEIAGVMERLPEDVVISLKNTPHDYYPTFPDNNRIGNVGNHRQWIEYDAMGQYFGWGVAMADLTGDYRKRMCYAREKGATGVVIRTDWESLDGHTAFGTPNRINLYAGAMLAADPGVSDRDIYLRFLRSENWLKDGLTPEETGEAARWFGRLMGGTWEATRRMLYVQGCVFSDSSLMPVSFAHAFWLAEEKNSLKAWDPSKADALAPDREHLEAALAEKKEAVERVTALCALSGEPPAGIRPEKAGELARRFGIHREYAEMYAAAVSALMLTRYVRETEEDRNSEYYRAICWKRRQAVEALADWEIRLRRMAVETDYTPHTVYTLMDGDRMRCLYRDLREEETDEIG